MTHPDGNPDIWYGANIEIGHVSRRFDINPWNAELKAIVGTRTGRIMLAANLNIDFALSGPAPSPPAIEVATKFDFSLSRTLSVGLESYNGIGDLKHLGRFGDSDQTVLATTDIALGQWGFELGAGRGFGANPDHFIVKLIASVPIDRLLRGSARDSNTRLR